MLMAHQEALLDRKELHINLWRNGIRSRIAWLNSLPVDANECTTALMIDYRITLCVICMCDSRGAVQIEILISVRARVGRRRTDILSLPGTMIQRYASSSESRSCMCDA
jgi:hypothetical protein